MCTYTGLQVNPMNIQDEDIRTEDIAHALSLLCRGGGHMKQLYTVGQHCLNCANEAKARGWNTRIFLPVCCTTPAKPTSPTSSAR